MRNGYTLIELLITLALLGPASLVFDATVLRRECPERADLIAEEAVCEAERKEGAVSYSIERHISLLAALFAEARKAAQP